MLRMSFRCIELERTQGRSLRWTEGRAQCGAIGTAVEHLTVLYYSSDRATLSATFRPP